jgi:hypothetical protein
MEKERKAKGAMLVALAMIIKSMKEIDWVSQTDLTQNDLDLIQKQGILSSNYYDAALWERMGMAVFKVVGKSQPENASQFGYGILAETILRVYKGPLQISDPAELLAKIASLYGSAWYTFGTAEFETKDNGGIFRIKHPNGIPMPECFVPMSRGFLKRLAEASEGKNVKVICQEEGLSHMQKLTVLTLKISWE